MKHRIFLLFSLIGIFCAAFIFVHAPRLEDEDQDSAEARMERDGRSGALEALDFWNRARAYPDREIPPSAYMRAYALAKTKDRYLPVTLTAGAVWDPIGPSNLQGRTRCVAVNPQNRYTVYIGTASGGLWVSHSMGLGGDWERVSLGFPALGISSILINPLDTNEMYLGTGEVYGYQNSLGGLVVRTTRGSYGIGILKTTDGGETWTKSLDWSYQQQRGIEMLKFNPRNPSSIFAATSEGMYRTTDAGATWNQISSIILAKDVIVNPSDTNIVVGAFGNFASPGAGVYISSDYGATWNITDLPEYSGKVRLAVYERSPNMLYASVADSTTGTGGLWMSADYGNSWFAMANSSANPIFQVQGWYSHYVVVHPTDSSKVIHNSVLRSKSVNGGVSFTNVPTGYSDNHGYALDPVDPNIVYGVGDDGVYRSTDFGGSWTNIGNGIQSGQLYNGFSCSASDSLVAIGQSQDHIPGYRYTGTSSWNHAGVSDEAGWTAIDPTNDNYMYCVDRFGSDFLRSTNRGSTWVTTTSFGGAGAWNSPIIVAPSSPATLYMGDVRIRKTSNRGTSWSYTNGGSVLDGNPAISIAISSTSPDTVFAGMAPQSTAMHIFRTTNGGSSWTNVGGGLPNRYPLDLAVDPTDSRIVLAAFGGFGTGHLFKSTDAGGSWNDISGTLPDVPTDAIAIDPLHHNNIYVGNDLGVYLTTDGGASWSNFSEGLPDAVIAADLVVSPSNRALRIATHGNGVWERKLVNELPADYTDFAAQALISPKGSGRDTLDAPMGTVRASFRNLSVPGHTQVTLKYRIVKSNVEVYSSTVVESDFPPGETRVVTFPAAFTPATTGTYQLEATVESPDANRGNDTVRANYNVLEKPTIYRYTSATLSSPYTEISGGSAGPAGDDAQSRAVLPFQFRFDGFLYDSVQISTNGWMEFGTGARGSFRGLSTDEQIGGYFNQALATTDRPTKVLAPWWTDMATNTGQISYKVTGSAPDRVFTVQWKNVLSNYDAGSTDVMLNFQIRLHETSDLIEFCYGPATGSFFSGAGASMGAKDYVGGDYRFYDLALRGTGTMGTARTDLTPLDNWPGADSVITITTNDLSTQVSLSAGWNLVSVPLFIASPTPLSLYGGNLLGKAFDYSGGYRQADTMIAGRGYWVKLNAADTPSVSGGPLAAVSVSVQKGWNLIGSCDHTVNAPSGGIVISPAYEYGGLGYAVATTLVPGKGYWVKTSASGTLSLGPASVEKPPSTAAPLRETVSLSITDGTSGQVLSLVRQDPKRDAATSPFELPPPPPAPAVDARFSNGCGEHEFPPVGESIPLKISGGRRPVSLTVNGAARSVGIALDEYRERKLVRSTTLRSGLELTLLPDAEPLLRGVEAAGTPSSFALYQNYPNPFNPSTTIRFDLPDRAFVSVTLYDVVGREIRHLAEGEFEAGNHSLRTDLSDLASGVYLYGIKAGTFSQVKKLLLVR